jgi:hypothetical protein
MPQNSVAVRARSDFAAVPKFRRVVPNVQGIVNLLGGALSEAVMGWFFQDQSHWHFFSPKPWQDLRSVSGERIIGRAVRRKVNGQWEYMNLDEDKLLDELLLQKEAPVQ